MTSLPELVPVVIGHIARCHSEQGGRGTRTRGPAIRGEDAALLRARPRGGGGWRSRRGLTGPVLPCSNSLARDALCVLPTPQEPELGAAVAEPARRRQRAAVPGVQPAPGRRETASALLTWQQWPVGLSYSVSFRHEIWGRVCSSLKASGAQNVLVIVLLLYPCP